jgi:uncharacterized membrane protein YqjE
LNRKASDQNTDDKVRDSVPPDEAPTIKTPAVNQDELKATDKSESAHDLSTVELVRKITAEVSHLVQKQFELAKTELKEDVKSEATMVGGLGLAAFAASTTVTLLLVTIVFALAQAMPGWAAGLLVSGCTMAASAIIGWLAWRKRVRSPLARTQRTLHDDVQWTKDQLR